MFSQHFLQVRYGKMFLKVEACFSQPEVSKCSSWWHQFNPPSNSDLTYKRTIHGKGNFSPNDSTNLRLGIYYNLDPLLAVCWVNHSTHHKSSWSPFIPLFKTSPGDLSTFHHGLRAFEPCGAHPSAKATAELMELKEIGDEFRDRKTRLEPWTMLMHG